jgi:hypothetical protein
VTDDRRYIAGEIDEQRTSGVAPREHQCERSGDDGGAGTPLFADQQHTTARISSPRRDE